MKTRLSVVKRACSLLLALAMGAGTARADLFLHYTFDEAAGDALDSSGYGASANGTLFGDATRTTSTPSGSGRALDLSAGANDYTYAADPNKLDGLTKLTLCLWVNLRAGLTPGISDRLLSKWAGEANGFDWTISSSGSNLALELAVNSIGTSVTTSVAEQQWVFFAVTYDGGSTSNNVKFYRGTTLDTVSLLGSTTLNKSAIVANSAQFRVGSTPATSSDRTPPAWFDDVRIYDDILDQAVLEAVRLSESPQVPEPAAAVLMVSGVLGLLLLFVPRRQRV